MQLSILYWKIVILIQLQQIQIVEANEVTNSYNGSTFNNNISDNNTEDLIISPQLETSSAPGLYSAEGVSISLQGGSYLILENINPRVYILQKQLRTIFGRDDRYQVRKTTDMPFRSIGRVGKGCTGTVVGPRHVLTAAHCVITDRNYKNKDPIFNTDLSFRPAAFGNTAPYGRFDWLYAFYPQEFKNDPSSIYDYAVIILKESLPADIEPLQLQKGCPQNIIDSFQKGNYSVNIAGYPGDLFYPKDSMWATGCIGVNLDCNQPLFKHKCDTASGMSGSSMFAVQERADGSKDYIIRAVHSGGGAFTNVARLLTNEVVQKINEWMRSFE